MNGQTIGRRRATMIALPAGIAICHLTKARILRLTLQTHQGHEVHCFGREKIHLARNFENSQTANQGRETRTANFVSFKRRLSAKIAAFARSKVRRAVTFLNQGHNEG
jgi:hypothetical protein